MRTSAREKSETGDDEEEVKDEGDDEVDVDVEDDDVDGGAAINEGCVRETEAEAADAACEDVAEVSSEPGGMHGPK